MRLSDLLVMVISLMYLRLNSGKIRTIKNTHVYLWIRNMGANNFKFTPVFSEVRVTRSLVVYVCFVNRCLSICHFSFGHWVVCPSSIYGFWLPLWYLQTLLVRKQVPTEELYRDRYNKEDFISLHLNRYVITSTTQHSKHNCNVTL
jgi:hypothetical protein